MRVLISSADTLALAASPAPLLSRTSLTALNAKCTLVVSFGLAAIALTNSVLVLVERAPLFPHKDLHSMCIPDERLDEVIWNLTGICWDQRLEHLLVGIELIFIHPL